MSYVIRVRCIPCDNTGDPQGRFGCYRPLGYNDITVNWKNEPFQTAEAAQHFAENYHNRRLSKWVISDEQGNFAVEDVLVP